MAICEIISVGTELLLGDIINTDARFLSEQLAQMGISVYRQTTVGDNEERLNETFLQALSRSDIVILTGGLGPTEDDITKEVCCAALNERLVKHEETENAIKEFFEKRGYEMPQSNMKQAFVPENGIILKNENGTAPGLVIEKNQKCVILLPGPPNELEGMFKKFALPYLRKYSESVIVSRKINTIQIGESALAELAGDFLKMSNPTVAPYAKSGEAFLRLTAGAETREAANLLLEPVLNELTKRLAPYIYGIDAENMETAVVKLLKEKQKKLSVAESCTAGYIAKRITDIPGASQVFDCGAVTYSNEMKMKLLNVKAKTLQSHGAVSEETAREMAEGMKKLSGADIAIAVTGIAGPENEGKKPAGLSYVAAVCENKTVVEKIETGRNGREYNRYVTGTRALNLARKLLLEMN